MKCLSACLALLGVIFAGPAWSQAGAGAACLQVPPSARANGMGQAHVSVASDAEACWWNPAATAFLGEGSVRVGGGRLPLQSNAYFTDYSFAMRVGDDVGIAAGVPFLYYGKNVATDSGGIVIGEFASWEIAPTFAVARRVNERVSVGGSIKYVRSDLAPASVTLGGEVGVGQTVAFDLALFYRDPDTGFRFGLNFQNLGPSISFLDEDQADPLPRNLKFGIGYEPTPAIDGGRGARVIIAADLNKRFVSAGDGIILNLGGEVAYLARPYEMAVRLGWIYEGWFQEFGPVNGPTWGAGVRVFGATFDFANIPVGPDLGRIWRWTFGAQF